jgi:hypothetical protein
MKEKNVKLAAVPEQFVCQNCDTAAFVALGPRVVAVIVGGRMVNFFEEKNQHEAEKLAMQWWDDRRVEAVSAAQ